MTKNNEFLYVKDQEGFAVMKTKDQLEIGDIIITEEEYEEICGENQ
jgi:S-adenosylhomocysteine hydrolase